MGWHRVVAARPRGGLDPCPSARPHTVRCGRLDGLGPRRPARARAQRPHRGRVRRGPGRLRTGRAVRRRPETLAPPAPRHPVRRCQAHRRGPHHLAARRAGRRYRTGPAAVERITVKPLPDLASRHLGGGVVAANDEFFAERDNLLNPEPPTHRPGTFGARGQVYDGWETRRRREPGHDFAIVRLGVPGIVHRVVIDTSFFTGNYPPYASVEGCGVEGYPSPDELADAEWIALVPRDPLTGDHRNEPT